MPVDLLHDTLYLINFQGKGKTTSVGWPCRSAKDEAAATFAKRLIARCSGEINSLGRTDPKSNAAGSRQHKQWPFGDRSSYITISRHDFVTITTIGAAARLTAA